MQLSVLGIAAVPPQSCDPTLSSSLMALVIYFTHSSFSVSTRSLISRYF